MTNDPASETIGVLQLLAEAVDALRAAGHDVVPSREVPGLYRVDDRPDRTTGEVIALAWQLGLMGGSAKVQ